MTVQPITTGPPAALALQASGAPSRINDWVGALAMASQAASTIVDTPLCPDAWWPLPPGVKLWNIPDRNPRVPLPNEDADSFHRRRQVAIATGAVVLSAAESLGLDTLAAAITGVYVVGAKPSLYAETMLGLIHEAGWRSKPIERSATRGAVALWRRNEPEDTARVYEFTMEQAITAGYVKGKGPNAKPGRDGKPNHAGNEQYDLRPETMLYWRAVSIGCRLEAPELMKGMKSAEELADEVTRDATPERVTVTVTSPRAITPEDITAGAQAEAREANRSLRGAPAGPAAATAAQTGPSPLEREEPEAPQAGAAEPAPARDDAPISEGTWNAINQELRIIGGKVNGLNGPGQKGARLAVISAIVGRPIGQGSELTVGEGRMVIENLAGDAGVRLCQGVLHPKPADQPTEQADPAADPGTAAQEHAAALDERIAAARAAADERAAAAETEQAQAAAYDPTADDADDPWAGQR